MFRRRIYFRLFMFLTTILSRFVHVPRRPKNHIVVSDAAGMVTCDTEARRLYMRKVRFYAVLCCVVSSWCVLCFRYVQLRHTRIYNVVMVRLPYRLAYERILQGRTRRLQQSFAQVNEYNIYRRQLSGSTASHDGHDAYACAASTLRPVLCCLCGVPCSL